MSNIDKQALREEFLNMQDHYSDPADRERQEIYIAAEELLDELKADKEQIKALESRNRRLDGIIDAAERRIAELDKRLIEYAGIATREAHRVAELEARTVNLPAACADDEYFIDGVFQALRYERDVERAISAAGIKVKGE
ncbi:TPA: ead/Ea22-like family protein [Salmonella enterica]|nr:ead/Ea22-like family protein [Salmonella enterica]